MMYKVAAIVAAIVVLGAGAFVFLRQDDKSSKTTNNSSSQSSDQATNSQNTANSTSSNSTNQTTSSDEAKTIAQIVYTDNGFSPSTTTIKAGAKVTIKNESSATLAFSSDPHPAHTENPQLNIDNLKSGESMTITLTAKGTWGFHNHLNSADKGSITVE